MTDRVRRRAPRFTDLDTQTADDVLTLYRQLGGAPRWKQRALYDAIKDASAHANDLRFARLSIYDEVSGAPLGAALSGRHSIDTDELLELLAARTSNVSDLIRS